MNLFSLPLDFMMSQEHVVIITTPRSAMNTLRATTPLCIENPLNTPE